MAASAEERDVRDHLNRKNTRAMLDLVSGEFEALHRHVQATHLDPLHWQTVDSVCPILSRTLAALALGHRPWDDRDQHTRDVQELVPVILEQLLGHRDQKQQLFQRRFLRLSSYQGRLPVGCGQHAISHHTVQRWRDLDEESALGGVRRLQDKLRGGDHLLALGIDARVVIKGYGEPRDKDSGTRNLVEQVVGIGIGAAIPMSKFGVKTALPSQPTDLRTPLAPTVWEGLASLVMTQSYWQALGERLQGLVTGAFTGKLDRESGRGASSARRLDEYELIRAEPSHLHSGEQVWDFVQHIQHEMQDYCRDALAVCSCDYGILGRLLALRENAGLRVEPVSGPLHFSENAQEYVYKRLIDLWQSFGTFCKSRTGKTLSFSSESRYYVRHFILQVASTAWCRLRASGTLDKLDAGCRDLHYVSLRYLLENDVLAASTQYYVFHEGDGENYLRLQPFVYNATLGRWHYKKVACLEVLMAERAPWYKPMVCLLTDKMPETTFAQLQRNCPASASSEEACAAARLYFGLRDKKGLYRPPTEAKDRHLYQNHESIVRLFQEFLCTILLQVAGGEGGAELYGASLRLPLITSKVLAPADYLPFAFGLQQHEQPKLDRCAGCDTVLGTEFTAANCGHVFCKQCYDGLDQRGCAVCIGRWAQLKAEHHEKLVGSLGGGDEEDEPRARAGPGGPEEEENEDEGPRVGWGAVGPTEEEVAGMLQQVRDAELTAPPPPAGSHDDLQPVLTVAKRHGKGRRATASHPKPVEVRLAFVPKAAAAAGDAGPPFELQILLKEHAARLECVDDRYDGRYTLPAAPPWHKAPQVPGGCWFRCTADDHGDYHVPTDALTALATNKLARVPEFVSKPLVTLTANRTIPVVVAKPKPGTELVEGAATPYVVCSVVDRGDYRLFKGLRYDTMFRPTNTTLPANAFEEPALRFVYDCNQRGSVRLGEDLRLDLYERHRDSGVDQMEYNKQCNKLRKSGNRAGAGGGGKRKRAPGASVTRRKRGRKTTEL